MSPNQVAEGFSPPAPTPPRKRVRAGRFLRMGKGDERTARVLGLPLLAVTPTARLVANRTEWLWFDPAEGLAIWRGPDGRHGFPARSLEEALALVGQVEGRAIHSTDKPS